MSDASFLELIDRLCEIHLGPTYRAYIVQPTTSRTKRKHSLKRKAYNAFFSALFQTHGKSNGGHGNDQIGKAVEGVVLEVYKMRTHRQFEAADSLENVYNELRDSGSGCQQIMSFIVALKGCNENSLQDKMAEDTICIPGPLTLRKRLPLLPCVPLNYGDIHPCDMNSPYYMHYPESVFERPFTDVRQLREDKMSAVFEHEPGKCLSVDFSHKFLQGDNYEQTTHVSLFGGLMQGRTSEMNVHLSLPDLGSDFHIRIPEFSCKRSLSISKMSDESGLGSGSLSLSSSLTSFVDGSRDDDDDYEDGAFWEAALTVTKSQHYTWEWIGYLPGPTERPRLTEAGPEVFDVLVRLRQRVSRILCPQSIDRLLVTVPLSVLVRHILLMLIGVPSKLFPFNQETLSFHIVEGLHVSGTSPEMLASFLADFVECGTHYARLANFSQPPVLNSFYTAGLVFQAFIMAVRKYLNHFTAAVLKVPVNCPLLQLKMFILKAMEQLRYLAKLCQCHDQLLSASALGQFPTGMKLLSYLYDEAQESSSSAHHPLLLSILQTTFAPFMLFIQDWIFHGVHRDFYDEFMIHVDLNCSEARDETYWSKAYTLIQDSPEGDLIPHFIKDKVQDIITCGKSINLLRVWKPQHFMCNVAESDIPTLSVTFSLADLAATDKYCLSYVGKMRQISLQQSVDRQEHLRRVEQRRTELQHLARQVTEHEISRLQGVINARKQQRKAKKQLEFDQLKLQMEADLQRRASEKEQAKDADKMFMARFNREEHALTKKEIELEQKARDDLIAYYLELGEEAMHRERVALWRVRRGQLEQSRILFLEADAERWRQEMSKYLQTQTLPETQGDVPDSGPQTVPSWVSKFSSSTGSPVIVSEDEIYLPSWAQQHPPVTETLAAGGYLPSWAQRTTGSLVVENNDNPTDLDKNENFELKTFSNDPDPINDHAIPQLESKTEMVCEPTSKGKGDKEKSALSLVPGILENDEKCAMEINSDQQIVSKTHVKFVDGKGIHTETEEAQNIKHIKTYSTAYATKESEVDSKVIKHIRTFDTRYSTKESDQLPEEPRPRLKFQEGAGVSYQSSEERQIIPCRQKNLTSQSVTQESEAHVWIIKKPNMFGHVSQLSNSEYILTVPKLRRQSLQHANMESDFKDFAIKPSVGMNKTRFASRESEDTSSGKIGARTHIRTWAHRHANLESDSADIGHLAVERFRRRNRWGHSSDSTIQHILYGDPASWDAKDKTDGPAASQLQRIEFKPGLSYQAEPYPIDFSGLNRPPELDLMSHIAVLDLGRDLISSTVSSQEEVDAYQYTPLSVLLARSIMTPIRAQVCLVNSALINYFTSELKVDEHFEAIRRYLLMADGDFAEILSNILLEKMFKNPKPHEILNPVFLNSTLKEAVRSSIHSNDEKAQNLSFSLTHTPQVFLPHAPESLNCLQLQYSVSWPLNIILTSASMKKYYTIFTFLLQIKRAVWSLKDIWHRLKRDALIFKIGNASQFRQLQLYRQEMEHFVKMMQGYITNQVILVSWQEFQTSLSQPLHQGLDQLQALHEQYVNKALSRCLLDGKAEKVMKIIQDIFNIILKFRAHLVSSAWHRGQPGDPVTHPNFANMVKMYNSFHAYSFFLFKVTSRLSHKGYQPHLQELLLQLNFNDFYTDAAT